MFERLLKLLFPADDDITVSADDARLMLFTRGKETVSIAWDAITDIQVIQTALDTSYPSLVWTLISENKRLSFTNHTPGAEEAIKRIWNLSCFDTELYGHALETRRSHPLSIYRRHSA